MKIGSFSASLVVVSLLLVSLPVSAQSPEVRAGARSAAESGYEAFEAGQFDKALDYFTRAEDLIHAPPHLLYIARSRIELGKLVAAREAYLKIVREEFDQNAPGVFLEAQKDAEVDLAALEPRLPSVNVMVKEAGSDPVEVYLDGRLVPAALIGIPHPIDPGDHRLEAKSVGLASEVKSVHFNEGEKLEVTLELRPTVAPAAALQDLPGEDRVSWTSPLAIGGYASLAVGAGGVALGAVFLDKRSSSQSEADRIYACNPGCTGAEKNAVRGYESDAQSQLIVGVVGLSAGGAALATGVTLLILNAGKKGSSEAASVQPWIGWSQAGVSGVF